MTTRLEPSEQSKGAAIGLMACSLQNLDYALRHLQQYGRLKHELKHLTNLTQAHGEKLLVTSQKHFDCQDADAVLGLSEVLPMASHLLLQLTPAQIEASLQHMNEMARSNAVYVPVPTPPSQLLVA